MKVNNNTVNSATPGSVRGADVGKTKDRSDKMSGKVDAKQVSADLDSAKIEMSKDALAMQKAKAIASNTVSDDAKIARLQKMIDQGEYKVDAEAVADRLVNEHLLTGE